MGHYGKIYVVWRRTEGRSSSWTVLNAVEKHDFCGVPCLRGRPQLTDGSRLRDSMVYIPISHIELIAEYESIEAFLATRRQAKTTAAEDSSHSTPEATHSHTGAMRSEPVTAH